MVWREERELTEGKTRQLGERKEREGVFFFFRKKRRRKRARSKNEFFFLPEGMKIIKRVNRHPNKEYRQFSILDMSEITGEAAETGRVEVGSAVLCVCVCGCGCGGGRGGSRSRSRSRRKQKKTPPVQLILPLPLASSPRTLEASRPPPRGARPCLRAWHLGRTARCGIAK